MLDVNIAMGTSQQAIQGKNDNFFIFPYFFCKESGWAKVSLPVSNFGPPSSISPKTLENWVLCPRYFAADNLRSTHNIYWLIQLFVVLKNLDIGESSKLTLIAGLLQPIFDFNVVYSKYILVHWYIFPSVHLVVLPFNLSPFGHTQTN